MRKYEPFKILTHETLFELNANVQELGDIITETERVTLELKRSDLTEEETKHWEQRARDVLVRSKTVRKY